MSVAYFGAIELEDGDPETLTVADFFAFLVADDERPLGAVRRAGYRLPGR